MKIKSGFVLHSLGNEHVVVAVEDRTKDFRGMIRLNGTGAYLWKLMNVESDHDSLVRALMDEYEIPTETASEAVASFVSQLSEAGVIE